MLSSTEFRVKGCQGRKRQPTPYSQILLNLNPPHPPETQPRSSAKLSKQVAELKSADYGFVGALDSAWLCLCGASAKEKRPQIIRGREGRRGFSFLMVLVEDPNKGLEKAMT